jgi:hypothetical protein
MKKVLGTFRNYENAPKKNTFSEDGDLPSVCPSAGDLVFSSDSVQKVRGTFRERRIHNTHTSITGTNQVLPEISILLDRVRLNLVRMHGLPLIRLSTMSLLITV